MNNQSKHAETINGLAALSFTPVVAPFSALLRRAAGIILMQEQRIHEQAILIAQLQEDINDVMLNNPQE